MKSAKSLQSAINKALIKLGHNVTLDNAEKSVEFKKFKNGVTETIKKQVKLITSDIDFINQLLSLSTKGEVNNFILSFLDKKWVLFNTMYSQINNKETVDFLEWAGNVGGQAALSNMGIDVVFNLENKEVTRYLSNRAIDLQNTIDDTTKKEIANLIDESRKELLTTRETAKYINSKFKDISLNRATVIAQNELANAVSAVELETYIRSGIKQIRWVTSIDDRVCPICSPLHNTIINTGNSFVSGDNISQRPPIHIGCRCYMETVYDEINIINNKLIWTGN